MTRDSDTITLAAAKRHAEHYASVFHDRLMDDHRSAIDCWDCEAFLQLGIDAFGWLIRADRELRLRAYEAKSDVDPAIQQELEERFRQWLAPCDAAEQWIASVEKQGRTPTNLAEFRHSCEEARAIVEFLDDSVSNELPGGMIPLRDIAIDEHRNGETAEFL